VVLGADKLADALTVERLNLFAVGSAVSLGEK
jgi:hypothetical protein